MLKLLDTTSFYKKDEPTISILNLSSSTKGLEKVAAHEDIQAYLDVLVPKPDHTYLHINAMTAGEYHGSNKNADFFPEENLKKYHKTFETNPAHVFRSHINKDPKKSFGKVIYSAYNDRMHRVELICECPDELVSDIKDRIAYGEYPTTSMACKTPADTCSICGNRAHSRQEYCHHLKNELGKLYQDGRKVCSINDQPLSFFDISFVVRPADVNSSVLQKVADSEIISSAELAEIEGLTEDSLYKTAAFKKISELIKEITDGCYVVGAGKTTEEILGSSMPKDLPLYLVERLHHFDLSSVLSSMASLGISPSLKFLAELIARKRLGEGYEGIGTVVENFLSEVPHDENIPMIKFEEPVEPSPILVSALSPFVRDSSIFSSEIEKRASNIGYSGNGPHIEPNEQELFARRMVDNFGPQEQGSPSYTKLLLGLGGAALLAKYFITAQIEKKLRERDNSVVNNVKITIVKSASEIFATSRLSKMAMVESLPRQKSQEEYNSTGAVDVDRLGLKITKRILNNTNTSIGGKLAGLMRIFSLGSRVSNLSQ